MQIKHSQLLASGSTYFSQKIPKVVVLNGDETLLVEETLDYLRREFKAVGFDERLSYQLSTQFKWDNVLQMGGEMSLFSQRRLVEVRVNGKLGSVGSKAVLQYLDGQNNDDTWLLILPKLDFQQRKSKWYLSLVKQGWVVDVEDVKIEQFSAWLKQRLQSRALRVEAGVVEMMQVHLEGNLLAAAQEVDKLHTLSKDGAVTMRLLRACLADHSRYDIFVLIDTVLCGELDKALKILARLKGEGVALVVILWALVKEIRQLSQISFKLNQGESKQNVFRQYRIWSKREPQVNIALDRMSQEQWQSLHQLATNTDQIVKGQRSTEFGDAWVQIERLLVEMCKINPTQQRLGGQVDTHKPTPMTLV